MSSTTANHGLFRIYAIACLIAAVFVITIVFEASNLPDLGIVIYLGIGVALFILDLALTGTVRQRQNGLARLVLLASFALVWPAVVVALIVYLGWAVAREVRQ